MKYILKCINAKHHNIWCWISTTWPAVMRVRPYCRCPLGKLISFFPRRHTVTIIHSYDQADTFSSPVDCFVSFQGPFVLTDSALAFPAILQPIKTVNRVPRLRMPRRCTFSADAGESPVGCRHNLPEADCRQGSAIDVFFLINRLT